MRASAGGARRWLARGIALLAIAAALVTGFGPPAAHGEVLLPQVDRALPIVVSAKKARRWQEGSYEVWLLDGNCQLHQGRSVAQAGQAVLWIDRAAPTDRRPSMVIAYLEGDVQWDHGFDGAQHTQTGRAAQTMQDASWLGKLYTVGAIQMHTPFADDEPTFKPAVYRRAVAARQPQPPPAVQPTQYLTPVNQPATTTPNVNVPPTPARSASEGIGPHAPHTAGQASSGTLATPHMVGQTASATPAMRSVHVRSRSSTRMQWEAFPGRTADETVVVVSGGVNLVVQGLGNQFGAVDVSTDRMVIWARGLSMKDVGGAAVQSSDMPLEVYMEGNIVFRQGDRVIYARSMYYDVRSERGVVLEGELLTPVPQYQGLIRLKADVVQQLDRQNFQAHQASVTSSRMGVPSYWFQSEQITLSDVQQPIVDPVTGQVMQDPATGKPAINHRLRTTARNNFVYLYELPVLYWPQIATDLSKPTYYLDEIQIGNDSIFGTQVRTSWDMYQVLGIQDPPVGTEWLGQLDVLTDRGVGVGTLLDYRRDILFGVPGLNFGQLHAWGIKDDGIDNLGEDRNFVLPEKEWRGRVRWQHRHFLPSQWQLSAEVGLISDRNFLEEYYEYEWDQLKDQTTDVELKRLWDNQSLSVFGQVRLNDFFAQTEWLPRVDHSWLGQSLLGDRLTWFAHSHVGYAQLRAADAPPPGSVDAAKFAPLAWERDSSGVRAATRQEIDLPVQLGPVKAVPYVLGEAAHWGEDLGGNDLTRLYGQTGVRASLPFWRADPNVRSELLNLNGLAHKAVLEADVFYADANRDLGLLPLYDELDDDATEHFRRRFGFNTFDPVFGVIPLKYDERYFALRRGMQSWVAAPSTEIADDLMIARLGLRQRWQTKRGLPGQQRIVDLLTIDVESTLFPSADRDNFGQEAGPLEYDVRWHLGDRLTLLSDGFFDFFGDGLRTFSVGGMISRPEVGNAYLGFRSIEGPITSSVLSASFNYRMAEKWIATAYTAVDLSDTGNIGQSFDLTRIGESFLVRVGMNVDSGRDNVGFRLAIEPRFLPASRRAILGGVPLAPAGAYGLE